MKDFFIKIWDDVEKDDIRIEYIYSIENLLSFINNNKDKKISVYEGKCLLDWS
jgi:hypothetical protein